MAALTKALQTGDEALRGVRSEVQFRAAALTKALQAGGGAERGMCRRSSLLLSRSMCACVTSS